MNKYYFTNEIAYALNPPLSSKFSEIQKELSESLYASKKKAPLGHSPISDIPKKHNINRYSHSALEDLSVGNLICQTEFKLPLSVYGQDFNFRNKLVSLPPAGLKSENPQSTGNQMKEILEQKSSKESTVIVPSSYARKLNLDRYTVFNPGKSDDESEMKSKVFQLRTAIKDRNSVEILWNLLKIKNHTNFMDLKSAFEAYQSGNQKITASDLQRMCQKIGLYAPLCIIKMLIRECDLIDKDGSLSFEEFMHCLNWKDLMPIDSKNKTSKYSNDWFEGINKPPLDVINHYKTTYLSMGDHITATNERSAGIANFNNRPDYGLSKSSDHEDLPSIIQPNAFSKYGVLKDDLSKLHPKEKINDILIQSGIQISNQTFEKAWFKVNRDGFASIGNIWNELKYLCQLQS